MILRPVSRIGRSILFAEQLFSRHRSYSQESAQQAWVVCKTRAHDMLACYVFAFLGCQCRQPFDQSADPAYYVRAVSRVLAQLSVSFRSAAPSS
jgi:hypothetical protein